jgi:hypothetical protein
MRSLLGSLGIYLLINLAVLACGLGIGALLQWLVSAIPIATGTLIGVVTTGISLYAFGRLMALPLLDMPDEEVLAPPPRPPSVDAPRTGRRTGKRWRT